MSLQESLEVEEEDRGRDQRYAMWERPNSALLALNMEGGPSAEECAQLLEASKERNGFSPRAPEGTRSTDTLILTQWDIFWTSDLQNYR